MENKAFMSKAIRYQKTASDSVFSIMTTLQSSGEKILKQAVDQMSWLPENGKTGLMYWCDTCTKSTLNLKEVVDQSYIEVQKYLEPTSAKAEAKPKTAKATPGRSTATPKAKTTSAKTKAVAATKTATAKPASRKTTVAKKSPPKTSVKTVAKAAAKPVTKSTGTTKTESAPKPATIAKNSNAATKPKAKNPAAPEAAIPAATPSKA